MSTSTLVMDEYEYEYILHEYEYKYEYIPMNILSNDDVYNHTRLQAITRTNIHTSSRIHISSTCMHAFIHNYEL